MVCSSVDLLGLNLTLMLCSAEVLTAFWSWESLFFILRCHAVTVCETFYGQWQHLKWRKKKSQVPLWDVLLFSWQHRRIVFQAFKLSGAGKTSNSWCSQEWPSFLWSMRSLRYHTAWCLFFLLTPHCLSLMGAVPPAVEWHGFPAQSSLHFALVARWLCFCWGQTEMGQSSRDCPGFFGMKRQIFFNENMGKGEEAQRQ